MEQTINTPVNGLMTDAHPLAVDQTQLTDALNATIITFNGNELLMQNDMGNSTIVGSEGIVSLPEGSIPVGIKEHGGILYIASINKDGKGELGSFPSPEIRMTGINSNTEESFSVILPCSNNGKLFIPRFDFSKPKFELYTTYINDNSDWWHLIDTSQKLSHTVIKFGDVFGVCLDIKNKNGELIDIDDNDIISKIQINKDIVTELYDGLFNLLLQSDIRNSQTINLDYSAIAKKYGDNSNIGWWFDTDTSNYDSKITTGEYILDNSSLKYEDFHKYPNVPRGSLRVDVQINLPKNVSFGTYAYKINTNIEYDKNKTDFDYNSLNLQSIKSNDGNYYLFINSFTHDLYNGPLSITKVELIDVYLDGKHNYKNESLESINKTVFNQQIYYSNDCIVVEIPSDLQDLTTELTFLCYHEDYPLGIVKLKHNPLYVLTDAELTIGDIQQLLYDAFNVNSTPEVDLQDVNIIKECTLSDTPLKVDNLWTKNKTTRLVAGGIVIVPTEESTKYKGDVDLSDNELFYADDEDIIEKDAVKDWITDNVEKEQSYGLTGLELAILPALKDLELPINAAREYFNSTIADENASSYKTYSDENHHPDRFLSTALAMSADIGVLCNTKIRPSENNSGNLLNSRAYNINSGDTYFSRLRKIAFPYHNTTLKSTCNGLEPGKSEWVDIDCFDHLKTIYVNLISEESRKLLINFKSINYLWNNIPNLSITQYHDPIGFRYIVNTRVLGQTADKSKDYDCKFTLKGVNLSDKSNAYDYGESEIFFYTKLRTDSFLPHLEENPGKVTRYLDANSEREWKKILELEKQNIELNLNEKKDNNFQLRYVMSINCCVPLHKYIGEGTAFGLFGFPYFYMDKLNIPNNPYSDFFVYPQLTFESVNGSRTDHLKRYPTVNYDLGWESSSYSNPYFVQNSNITSTLPIQYYKEVKLSKINTPTSGKYILNINGFIDDPIEANPGIDGKDYFATFGDYSVNYDIKNYLDTCSVWARVFRAKAFNQSKLKESVQNILKQIRFYYISKSGLQIDIEVKCEYHDSNRPRQVKNLYIELNLNQIDDIKSINLELGPDINGGIRNIGIYKYPDNTDLSPLMEECICYGEKIWDNGYKVRYCGSKTYTLNHYPDSPRLFRYGVYTHNEDRSDIFIMTVDGETSEFKTKIKEFLE